MASLSSVSFYTRKDKTDGKVSPIYPCQVQQPTIRAAHWYQLNDNHELANVLLIRARENPAQGFDACEFPSGSGKVRRVGGSYEMGPGLWRVEVTS